jgi:hypothetical protein
MRSTFGRLFNKNWVLAAILICGASVVFSSCSKDDDDKDDKLTPNTYEVYFSAVLPECAAGFYTLNVEYTDGNGNTSTATVKAGDQSDAMPTLMNTLYENSKKFQISLLDWNDEKAKLFDNLIVKNFKMTVPAGKSFSYKVTMKGRSDYVKPSADEFYFVMPFTYSYSTRISGNSPDYSYVKESLSLEGMGPFESSQAGEFIAMFDGKVIGEESKTMK